MIGAEEQWIAYINDDDIKPDEFKLLSIRETADLSLPIAHLNFVTKDRDKMRRYTTPGYLVELGIGLTEPKPIAEFVVISKEVATYQGNDQWMIDIYMILNQMNYFKVHRTLAYTNTTEKKTSSEVFATVMGRYGLQVQTASSNDKMMWVQPNVSDRRFLEDVCSHGWFGSGRPVINGVRFDGKAIYKPIDMLLTPKGKMGNMTLEKDDLEINEFAIKARDGFLATWLGKYRKSPIHTLETDVDETITTSLGSVIADDPGLFDVTRYAPIAFAGDNVHSNWARSEAQNLQYRASLSAMSFRVMLHGAFKDVHVLDCYENVWEGSESRAAIVELSGKWLATEVAHKVDGSHYQVEITFSREKLLKDK